MSGGRVLRQEVIFMVQDDGPVGLDRVRVCFDDERAVADAGIALPMTLATRLGIEGLVDRVVRLGDRAGAANPGRKVMTLVAAMLLGADSIDDCDILRCGRLGALLGRVAAPSTLGTFLRAFTFGHVRQLDRVLAETLRRAWAAGAGPGDGRLVVDVDSFVGEVHGHAKQGASFGYTRQRGSHPILACRADTGEVLHIRLRKGSANSARGALRFVDELIARVTRAGASGAKLLRADSGFWNNHIFERLQRAGWQYSIGVRMQPHVRAAIEQIPDTDWRPVDDYPDGGEAQIAETTLGGRRLVVRRTRLLGDQGELFPDWRHFAFVTNRPEPLELVQSEHRQHAVVELRAVLPRMLEQGAGSIVNVSSMAGVTGLYDAHAYTAAKGAIANLTRSMAISYIKQGVRTNTVCPGFVDTPMIAPVVGVFDDPTVAASLAPIARPARPEEIANAILFFASDESSYCNGSTLLVDGGCTARSFPA